MNQLGIIVYTPPSAELYNRGPVREKPEPVKSDARTTDLVPADAIFCSKHFSVP